MKPLVVHIIDRLPPDGAERLLAEVLKNRSDRFDFKVLCLVDGGLLLDEIVDNGVSVEVLGRSSGLDLAHAWRLYRWFRKNRPAIVHTHLFTADAWGRTLAWLAGVPQIYSTVHSTNAWKSKVHLLVDKMLASVSNAVVACTDEVKNTLLKQGISRSKVTSIPNGVDLNRIADAVEVDIFKLLKLDNQTTTFALVGRLHEAKGHSDLLPVLHRLAEEKYDFQCLFIGEGELENALLDSIKEYRLQNKVVLTGFRNDVIGIIKALDFLVMPSRWEGLPISLLESMACATPVLASRVGGIPDVIEHDVDGLLYAAGDAEQLYMQLKSLLDQKHRCKSLGQAAEKKIIQQYSAASVSEKYEAMYLQDGIVQ